MNLEQKQAEFDEAIAKKDWERAREISNDVFDAGFEMTADKMHEIYCEEHLLTSGRYPETV